MIFLGTTFFSGKNSLYPTPAKQPNITSIKLGRDGCYNHLYASKSPDKNACNWDDEWDRFTLMNADFEKNPDAGNSGFSLRNTDTIVIRRREKGTNDWITVYTKKIVTLEDFDIYFLDKYARSQTNYQYMIASTINGVENSYIIQDVYSDFDGFYITDKDCIYGTIYDVDGCDTSRMMTSEMLELLNSKYMCVVSKSDTNCEKGSITGSFIRMDKYDCNADSESGRKYREDFKDRLANKRPLILKVSDGRIWMIKVTGTPQDNMKDHEDLRQISFDWVEIGDVHDMRTLYLNGFSDVESKWWY